MLISSRSCWRKMDTVSLSLFFIITFCKFLNGSANQFIPQILGNANIFLDQVKSELSKEGLEDSYLTTPQIIAKYGYPVEVHKITTEDGYILEIHRIPNPKGKPVLLQHGLLDSSAGFILTGPDNALGYVLWDAGYDVWMGNSRGNRYSRNHTTLNPNSKEFWQFSWHELGVYDLPAIIDFMIEKTGYDKLYYIGHSQGTTQFFVMCSEREKYNKKIHQMHALAPAVYASHVRSPLVQLLSPLENVIEDVIAAIELYEFPSSDALSLISGYFLCNKQSPLQDYCPFTFYLLAGYNPKEMNTTLIPIFLGHAPAGASLNQVRHYSQVRKSNRFQHYDYGKSENLKKYNQATPPRYNLSKVTAPVVLYYSLNDLLTGPDDVKMLWKELPNVIEKYEVPNPEFNHLDFTWGIHARELIYDHLLSLMKKAKF